MNQDTLNFFHDPDLLKVLQRIAGKIIHKSSARGISLKNIFGESISDPSTQELKETLVSEFLLENQDAVEKALAKSGENMGVCLERLFFRHILDCTRKLSTDPYRYLYKFIVDMMRDKADRFFLTPEDKRGSSYSLTKSSRPAGPLAMEDLKDIVFPHDRSFSRDFDSIRTRKAMEPLAVYFWENLCRKFNGIPIRVHVRDFVSWLALHIPVAHVFCSFSGSQKEPSAGGRESHVIENTLDICSNISISPVNTLEIQRTRKYARLFANRLTSKEKACLILRFSRDMDLKAMSKKLGYKGPSGPAGLMNAIGAKLKSFLRDLPWLGPEDLEHGGQEVLNIFLENLIIILKKSDSTPYKV